MIRSYRMMDVIPTINDIPKEQLTREIIEHSIKISPRYLVELYNSPVTRKFVDYDLCKLAVENKVHCSIEYVPETFRDIQLIIKSLECNPNNIKWLLDRNLANYDMLVLAIRKDPMLIRYVNTNNEYYEHLCDLAVSVNGLSIEHINEQFITNKLCETAVLNEGWSIKLIPDNYKTKSLWNLAVHQNGKILLDVPHDIVIDNIPNIRVDKVCYKSKPCKHNVTIGNHSLNFVGERTIKQLLDRWNKQSNDMYDHFNSHQDVSSVGEYVFT